MLDLVQADTNAVDPADELRCREADHLFGIRGPDIMQGGGGPDVLRGGHGFDTADGGAGNDECYAENQTSC